jgi:hypothetical protein
MSNGMVRISYYTSQSFKERIKDIAKINKKSVSSVVDELLEMAFARQERKLARLSGLEVKKRRKSFKINTGIQKVFTTTLFRLRFVRLGQMDCHFRRRLIGERQLHLFQQKQQI